MKVRVSIVAAVVALVPAIVRPQTPPQTVQDEYAVYDLLAPATGTFKTIYEVAVTSSGATEFRDRIGSGLTPVAAADDGAIDLMTGAALKLVVERDALRIQLARAVPADGGQARLRITKTYRDAVSYRADGNTVVFSRRVPLPRAAIVLPAGYQLLECNTPSQVLTDPDGRVRISFMNAAFGETGQPPGDRALFIKASPGAPTGDAARPKSLTNARSWEAPPSQGPTERARLTERAYQDRDIVYFLQQPETHAFSLYHDYTEAREGTDKYLNVVRTGSTVSNPSGKILDTGQSLPGEILTGAQLKAAGIDAGGESIAPDQQVVVTRFPAVKKGQSLRLRLAETYTAPQSYRFDGDELTFERSLGRPRNSVVLPRGWYLTALSIPGVIRQTDDGLTRVDFVNGRPDSIDVLLKARRLTRSERSGR
jgi:hypothetical protein